MQRAEVVAGAEHMISRLRLLQRLITQHLYECVGGVIRVGDVLKHVFQRVGG